MQEMEEKHQAQIQGYVAQVDALKQFRSEKEEGSHASIESLHKLLTEARSEIAILTSKCASHLRECNEKSSRVLELSAEISKKEEVIEMQRARIKELEDEVSKRKSSSNEKFGDHYELNDFGRTRQHLMNAASFRASAYGSETASVHPQDSRKLPPSPYVSRGRRMESSIAVSDTSQSPAFLSTVKPPHFATNNKENESDYAEFYRCELPQHTSSKRRPLDVNKGNPLVNPARRSSSLEKDTLSFLAKTKPSAEELQHYIEQQKQNEIANIAEHLSLRGHGRAFDEDHHELLRRLCRAIDDKYPSIDVNIAQRRSLRVRSKKNIGQLNERRKSMDEIRSEILQKRNEDAIELHRKYAGRMSTSRYDIFRPPGKAS